MIQYVVGAAAVAVGAAAWFYRRKVVEPANSAQEGIAAVNEPTWDDTGSLYSWLGMKYNYGYGTPKTTPEEAWKDGVDCSGFAQFALAEMGLLDRNYPDRTSTTLGDDCDAIEIGQQEPGDLAFYDGHVMVVATFPDAGLDGHSAVIGASGGDSSTKGDNPNACIKQFETALYRDDFLTYGRLKEGKAWL